MDNSRLCFFFIILFCSSVPFAGAQSDEHTIDNNFYNRLSPSMAIIIVIVIAAFFLMGFLSIYARQCGDSPSNSIRNMAGGIAGRSRHPARGLDASVIETFPILKYSAVKIHKVGKGALECAICLNEFEDTETLRLIPKCDHVFHPECIDEWLGSHTTCPVCRANLVPQPGESVHGIPLINTVPQDIEAQKNAVESVHQHQNTEVSVNVESIEPEVMGNRTRGSLSGWFRRSHSTGHSVVVQPGENTERFTLRLPLEVMKEILQNPELHRARSLVILPRETSTRTGYRTSGGDGSTRGGKSAWVFTMAPPFLVRASSMRSPRVANSAGEATSTSTAMAAIVDSSRPPI